MDYDAHTFSELVRATLRHREALGWTHPAYAEEAATRAASEAWRTHRTEVAVVDVVADTLKRMQARAA